MTINLDDANATDIGQPRSPTRSRSSSITSSNGLPPTFDALAPQRAPTTQPAEEVLIPIPGIAPIPGPSRLGPYVPNKEAAAGSGISDTYPSQVESAEGSAQTGGGVRLHVDAGPGCGGIAWPAGEVLSRYMAYRHEVDPGFLRGKNVLELGSGTGLVGLAVGLLERSAKVEVTDQAVLLDLMQRNIQLNYPDSSASSSDSTSLANGSDPAPIAESDATATSPQRPNVVASELNWGEPLPKHIKVGELDMVIAADCVYFEPAFPLLISTLLLLSPAPPAKPVPIYFCWKKRRKADKRFFAMLKKHFESVHVQDDRPGEREVYGREGVSLLLLTRRK